MNVNKIRSFCRVFRILAGAGLIGYGIYASVSEVPNYWFFLGTLPLIAGFINFCPLCIITKKCDIPEAKADA